MKTALKYNPEKKGLETLFRRWQITTLKYLWASPMEKFTTKKVWTHVREKAEKKVSRATIYHFLDHMRKKGVIKASMSTGRGGLRILFYSEYTEEEFKKMMAQKLIDSVKKNLLQVDE